MGIFSSTMNILLMILGFGVLIFVHELGHFLAAKWANIRTEGFAIGMGPVVCAWRKGIGLRLGSTEREYLQRAEAHMRSQDDLGNLTRERIYAAADEIGLGETEYSLRILPIGGFVKMLGQEDANPNATSSDPRSYNRCPVGKRMIVVSAGVVMNLILAAVLFMVVFSVGVPFPAAIVGGVIPGKPAATTVADNDQELRARGIDPVGLKPADNVISIDGQSAATFADIQIASAMSKPDQKLVFIVERPGVEGQLQFRIEAEKDELSGLRSVGFEPARSNVIESQYMQDLILEQLEITGLLEKGIVPGSTLNTINGMAVDTVEQVQIAADQSNGQAMMTMWTDPNGASIAAELNVTPEYQRLYATVAEDGTRDYELGLIGLVPTTWIQSVLEESPNVDVLRAGDVIARVGEVAWPRQAELRHELAEHAGKSIAMRVLRDDDYIDLMPSVRRDGTIGVRIGYHMQSAMVAAPMAHVGVLKEDRTWSSAPTPFAETNVLAGSQVVAVNDLPVTDWASFRAALQSVTAVDKNDTDELTVAVTLRAPTASREEETLQLALSPSQIAEIQSLGWSAELPTGIFTPVMTLRSSNGNPITALTMGVEETWKVMIQTYLTFDRLLRGTIGVEQLRGPVGIVHLGYEIADRGLLFLLFLLAAISVNLAVINFLPLPIVDGGLFLFLIYEKLKGRPPSIAFQNIATIAGLAMIISVFLLVTWNDVMRIVG